MNQSGTIVFLGRIIRKANIRYLTYSSEADFGRLYYRSYL